MSSSTDRSTPKGGLFGREAECQRLDGILQGLQQGRGGALVLSGEPGVGKTALLEYVVRQASDAVVVATRGLSSEASLSFAGLGDVLRPLLTVLGELPAPQSAALSAALALSYPEEPPTGYAVCVATLSLLTAAAEDRPVLVVVDDAQWLDAQSATALLFAAHRLSADAVVMVLATRAGEPTAFDPRGLEVVELAGLGRDASGLLLDRLRPGLVAHTVADELWRSTRGNPLALKEVGTRLDDARLGGRLPLAEPLPVGPGLEEAFASRVDPLPAATRTALLVVALSASSAVAELEGAFSLLNLDWSVLDAAEAAGLIECDVAQVVFSHPLMRAAVHGRATASSRRRAYDALASTAAGEARAWYRAASVAGTDDEVAQELEAAAEEIRSRTGFAAAARVLRRSADITADREVRARRLLAAGVDAQMAGHLHEATAWLDEARTLAADPLLWADIDLQRGHVLTWRGIPAVAHRVLVAAASAVSDLDRERAATLSTAAIMPACMEGRVEEAADHLRHAESLRHDGRDSQAHPYAFLVHTLAPPRWPSECRDLKDRMFVPVAPTVLPGDIPGLAMVGLCHAWIEDYGTARAILDRCIETARQVGAPSPLALALSYHSELDRWTGNWIAGYADAAEALRLGREMQQVATVGLALVYMARFEAAQGRAELARQHVAESRQLAEPLGIAGQLIYEGAAEGLLYLARGEPEEAIACLEPVRAFVHSSGIGNPNVVPWEADLIEAYWRAGRGVDAEKQLAELDRRAEATGLVWPRAAAARCRGLLAGEGDDAQVYFGEAMRLHDQQQQPFERARTALNFGEMLRRRRRRADARSLLRDALNAFQRLGAEPFVRRAAAELAATGERPRRRDDWSGLQQLTAQELQVALAVARGLSNPEVAAALFISRKTVEAHLSGAYRKLGLHSRTQLVRHMAQSGATQG
jgi:DNA-binding CsgD family transcriptional regulator